MFIYEFCKIFKNIFWQKTSGRLHLWILRSFSDDLFYRAPQGNCLFYVHKFGNCLFYIHILPHAFCLHFPRIHHFLRIHHEYFFRRGFESVRESGKWCYFRSSRPDEILENSQENTRASVSFSRKLLKKRLWHRCFPATFAKFLKTPVLTEDLRWLLLLFVI